MIPLALARELKEAGLTWVPRQYDLFMIPDRDLDDIIFIVSEMSVKVEQVGGQAAITFQGAYEWALDYILQQDVVWLPGESQLRDALERRLRGETPPALRLTSTPGGYVCEIQFRGEYLTFTGKEACLAYADALLYVMRNSPSGDQPKEE